MTDEQFEIYVDEVRQMRKELNDKIDNFRIELKGEIADANAELRKEIADEKSELKSELALTRAELRAEISKGRKEMMDLREDFLEETARNVAQHADMIKLMQGKIQDLDERKVDKGLKLLNSK